jgi:hypothetical protein
MVVEDLIDINDHDEGYDLPFIMAQDIDSLADQGETTHDQHK